MKERKKKRKEERKEGRKKERKKEKYKVRTLCLGNFMTSTKQSAIKTRTDSLISKAVKGLCV